MRNIYMDGGTKRNLACVVDEETGYVKLRRIKKTGLGSIATFEYEALITALTYIQKRVVSNGVITIHTDSMEILRFARSCKEGTCRPFSKLKERCLKKILMVSAVKPLEFHWVPRKHNLAGKLLEYYIKRRPPSMEFTIDSFICKHCNARYISGRDLQRHIYNRHVMLS